MIMRVRLGPSALTTTNWRQYAVRFLFGGLITAFAGIVAKKFGPGVGGLFLAFPAILPATATLVEKSEKRKKERAGLPAGNRGRKAAGVDAAGAAIGGIGLLTFALLVWKFLPRHGLWTVLSTATLAWLTVSVLLWLVRRRARIRR